MQNQNEKTAKKLTSGIVIVLVLCLCLCTTTLALGFTIAEIDNNRFSTATMDIDLNGGEPVIEEGDVLLEPGMTVALKNPFYIQNNSSIDVYYRLYFDSVEGMLADYLEVTIKDRDIVLYQGTLHELSRHQVKAVDDALSPNEKKELMMYFYYPPTSGNEGQDQKLSFVFCAEAVQKRNNPLKRFN